MSVKEWASLNKLILGGWGIGMEEKVRRNVWLKDLLILILIVSADTFVNIMVWFLFRAIVSALLKYPFDSFINCFFFRLWVPVFVSTAVLDSLKLMVLFHQCQKIFVGYFIASLNTWLFPKNLCISIALIFTLRVSLPTFGHNEGRLLYS